MHTIAQAVTAKSAAPRTSRWLGLGLAALGVALMAVAGGYFGYVSYARGRIGDVSVASPVVPAPSADIAPLGPQAPFTAPLHGTDPIWDQLVEDQRVVYGFVPVSNAFLPASGLSKPTRVRIPAIGLDSDVMQLRILDLDDARQYQTPPLVVGHIPESASPGEVGNSWLFGHLESPFRGEGSVFAALPEVHGLLKDGRTVYVIVDSADGEFLYQVQDFKVIPREELTLWESTERTVTLVTCWPRFVYDERVVVTTTLVGVRGVAASLDSPLPAG
jgi:LPXTG-site transpeptidase (sortase) family protein